MSLEMNSDRLIDQQVESIQQEVIERSVEYLYRRPDQTPSSNGAVLPIRAA
jgi:hypothetical protein